MPIRKGSWDDIRSQGLESFRADVARAVPFFADHCDRCHSGAKHGAPEAFRFDTLDDVRRHADRIFIRAAGPNTSMPGGPDDPPAEERDQLAEWLSCGAP